ETLVTLTFRKAGTGTDMTIHHEGFSTAERRDGHNNGWNGTFDKLAALLAKGAA
ncbi:MAG: SRPBCC domain-containing protein, partial [Alphaproteobacteria bacterium]|nr:SRPBCC domain-containing protein [Alphaproteobacteria bacterium]